MASNAQDIQMTQTPIRLHSLGQMAIIGLIGSEIVSLFFAVARGIGFLAVRIEDIPGEMISQLFSFQSFYFDRIIYFALGAIMGMIYHAVFRRLNQAGAKVGALTGLIQYILTGIFLALLAPTIPLEIQLLPSQSPLDSGMSFLSFTWIILLHTFYGWFLGIFATKNTLHLQNDSEGEARDESLTDISEPELSPELSKMNRKHHSSSDERLAS
jgi:hypothetical protein